METSPRRGAACAPSVFQPGALAALAEAADGPGPLQRLAYPGPAVEAPRFTSWNFPNSFTPHTYNPGRVDVESRVPRETLEALADLGHRVGVAEEWSVWASMVHVAAIDPSTRTLLAASDPREEAAAAIGW